MTTALALPSLLPGELFENGIALPDGLTFDEWARALRNAEWIERASPWWLVDLMEYGKRFGEEASQAFPTFEEDPTGAHQSKLKQAAWMAEKFPPDTRVPALTYTHHRAVADLEPAERAAMLRDAASEGLSTRDLIARVKDRQESIRLDASESRSEPICAADAEWHPTLSDVDPDWRPHLEARARQSADPALWIEAVLWAWRTAGNESLFSNWRD